MASSHSTNPPPPTTSPAPPAAPPTHSSDPSSSAFRTALSTISPIQDLQRLPNIPCARYSLLFGILAGASVGSLRFIFSRARPGAGRWAQVGAAANWAVGAWGVGSLGAWETCRRRQTSEATRMAALVSEVKARRAAKVGAGEGSAQKRIGGVLVGDKGIELQQQQQQQQQRGKGDGSAPAEAAPPPSEGKKGWLSKWV